MTNEEKYKTPEERQEAFNAFCDQYNTCKDCHLFTIIRRGGRDGCAFNWLALEAEEEKPLPCPFCGGDNIAKCGSSFLNFYYVRCKRCHSATNSYNTKADAIAAWNRRVK